MEVYVLDSLLRRIQVVDRFESLIWTERFSEIGDFEIDIKSTLESRSQFIPGSRLAINNSYRMMEVDTVEDATTEDGKDVLKVKGHSIERVLQDRIATTTTDMSNWDLVGTP